jgi:hypothetical protein
MSGEIEKAPMIFCVCSFGIFGQIVLSKMLIELMRIGLENDKGCGQQEKKWAKQCKCPMEWMLEEGVGCGGAITAARIK